MKTRIIYLVILAIIFPFLLVGQPSWSRVTPLPQENTLNDIVKIPGTNKLIAAGWGSTVMISDDAGITWDIKYNPAGMDNGYYGQCIYFLNSDIGFIGGSNRTILKTTNGGYDWNVVYYSGVNNWSCFDDIAFCNETTGFAVGDYTSIKKTTDGGDTWISIEPGNDFNLHQVEFCNKSIGFILGYSNEYILKTIDGGINWQIIDYPPGLENLNPGEIYFYNETLGFIFCSIYGSSSTATILKTTDSGETWNIVHTDPSAFAGSIDFIDDQRGIIGVGSWYSSNIFLTENGGDDWTNVDLPGFSWWNSNSVCFLDQENAFFTGHLGMLFKSSNGGHNWETLHERTFNGEILQVQFINDEIAYASSAGGSGGVATYDIYNTTDSGNNWSAINYFLGVSVFHFINEDIGVVAENMIGLNVYKTTNGGLDWTEIESGNFDFTPTCIRFYDEMKGLICGADHILITSDGGNNWIEVNSDLFTNSYTDIEYRNENEVYICGEDCLTSFVIKSQDGGYTWDNLYFCEHIDVKDIYFYNQNTVFLVGYDAILKSLDGGELWTETTINNDNSIQFYSINFPSEEIGYAVGLGIYETIVKTTNGGETWDVINSGTTSGLNGVYFSDANNGLIFGGGGVVLKTTTGGITGFEDHSINSEEFNISVFPNPFSDNISISIKAGFQEQLVISIYDLSGKLILVKAFSNNQNKPNLNLSGLENGIYFCKIKFNNQIISKKIIKAN